MYMDSVMEMAFGMVEVSESFKSIKEIKESSEFVSEKEKAIEALSKRSKGHRDTILTSNYVIKLEDAVNVLKSIGYTPAKYGVSHSYGIEMDELNLYKKLKQHDGYIVVGLIRDTSLTAIKESKTYVSFTYSKKALGM